MDFFEWNKIAGAVLFALLMAMGLGIFSDILFHTETPETPGIVIAVATQEGDEAEAEAPEAEPIGVLLASADAGAGESAARKCIACHTFAEGEANKVGPNLWDIVAHPIGARDGYQYSDAMIAYAGEVGDWSYEALDAYLRDPAGTVPKTKMAFAGLSDTAERANVIAYLRSLAADPVPLPEADAPAAMEEAAEEPAAEAAAEPEEAPAQEMAAAEPEEAPTEEVVAAEPEEAPAEEMAAAEPEAMEPETPAAEGEQTAMTEEEPAAEPEPTEPQTAEAEAPAEAEEQQVAAAEETAAEPEPAEPQTAEEEAPAAAEEQRVAAAEEAATAPAGDPAAGEAFSRRCIACHSFDPGGPNKVGPPLHGVVGRPIASLDGYNYSDAMIAFSEGGAKKWDLGVLGDYLADPRGVVKGTKMIFPGVKEDDLANILAYLATLQ